MDELFEWKEGRGGLSCGFSQELHVAVQWSVLLVDLGFVKLANTGFLIWQHTLYYAVVG